MTETPDPTWYDVLDVPRDASDEEIRAAWRNSTDRFGPGTSSGQFRMFNQAADVLLDPERRAAYDRSLAAPGVGSEPESTPPPPGPLPEATPDGVTRDPDAPADAPSARQRRREERRTARAQRAEARPVEPASRLQWLVAAGLAVLLLVALGVAAYYGLRTRQDGQVADARAAAPTSAERAAKAVLSYDYRQLDADEERAKEYLTPSYAKEFE
ncbi:MAG: DnaJ domain-containing protein, partial [Marmoricola sp.]